MIVEMAVIASLVIVTDQLLKAYLFDLSKQLSLFVGLIITNCIVMGRAEAALQTGLKPPYSTVVMGGHGIILISVAAIREFFGFGTLYGIPILPDAYMGNGLLTCSWGLYRSWTFNLQRSINKFIEE